jgi:hypothetical protein
MIRYTITAIKSNGQRELAFDKNSRNTYNTVEEAEQQKENVIKNNSKERVLELVGKDLEVRPVECYPGGDPMTWYFD